MKNVDLCAIYLYLWFNLEIFNFFFFFVKPLKTQRKSLVDKVLKNLI